MIFWLALALCVASIYAMPYNVPLQGEAGGKRTLVLMDDLNKVNSYSLFFNDLKSRGHHLTFFHAESSDISLEVYGEKLYDNVVFFAPKTEALHSIAFDDLNSFVQEGGNLFIAADREASDAVRDFVQTFGVALDKKGTEVIDHFENEASIDNSRQHVTVLGKNAIDSKAILGAFNGKAQANPVVFRGVGQKIAKESILALPVLRGNPSTYSFFPNKAVGESPESMGPQTVLVSAVQGRNNARVVISGSLDLFSNDFFGAELTSNGGATGNRLFAQEVSKWGFREAGVLRFRDITHHKKDGTPPDVILHEKERPDLPVTLYPDPEITRNSLVYRIKDEIVYSMVVEEFVNGEWKPFHADDMQMEFVMLDAYVRKTLTADDDGKFACTFIAPDSYGVFKFRVLYRRLGYSVLHAETQVSIRPFKHNEYERFIFAAYPYYTSAFSATVALFVFSIFFLFSSEEKK